MEGAILKKPGNSILLRLNDSQVGAVKRRFNLLWDGVGWEEMMSRMVKGSCAYRH